MPSVPDLTNDELTLALAVVGGLAVLAFLIVIFLAFRLRRLRRSFKILRGDGGDRDVVSTLSAWSRNIADMNERVEGLAAEQQTIRTLARSALQKFHLVRYDAFEDMGGRLSFSAALLDDKGDGVVITSINGRTETRTYAKLIRNYTSEHNLSEEEGEAIAGAVAGGTDRQASTSSR
jgi:hypothetical protein